MFYICIHNDKIIEFSEEYPYDTQDEKDWAVRNYGRLVTECQLRLPEIWMPYSSETEPFAFPAKKK